MARVVVLRWTQTREWRVVVPTAGSDDFWAVNRAMEEAVNASGIFQSGQADPESIRFEVTED